MRPLQAISPEQIADGEGMVPLGLEEDGVLIGRGLLPVSLVSDYASAVTSLYAREGAQRDIAPRELPLRIEDLFDNTHVKVLAQAIVGRNCPDLGVYTVVKPGTGGISFHTDGVVQGSKRMTLTAWAPLQMTGSAPRLCFIKASFAETLDYLRRAMPGRKLPGWHSPTEWNSTGAFQTERLEQAFGRDRFWIPDVELGDVVFFTNWSIHGTYRDEKTTGTRLTAILRFMPDQHPLIKRVRNKIQRSLRF